MSAAELDGLLGVEGIEARVEDALRHLKRLIIGEGSPAGPPSDRVASAAGKGLRPALTFASAGLGRDDSQRTLNAAIAVELVQVGSLVHDDIFEEASVRRAVPTINAVEGNNVALMAGDYILARAAEAAARAGDAVAHAVGRTIESLCIGQFLETFDLFDAARTVESHLSSIRGKTAALFACSCEVGALCAGIAGGQVAALSVFGESFGMAFQLVDDVLDLVSDEARLGKPANIDLTTGVYTLPVLLALQGPDSSSLKTALANREPEAARDLVLATDATQRALARASAYAADASAALAGVEAGGLRSFPQRYIRWALDRFAA
jgi:geranylgeranyl pyrophosphate synthase